MMQAKTEKLNVALATAQGERDQFRRERDNLIHGGKGLMYPSCWTADNGDTQYIFNVTIRDTGLIVQNIAPPNRMKDEAWTYIDPLPFETEIPEQRFRNATARLFTYSRGRDCRFVLTMHDETGRESKERYKQLRTLVEGHFYVSERVSPVRRSRALPVPNAPTDRSQLIPRSLNQPISQPSGSQ